jgi:purine-nucleoside phosphorylase
MNAATVQEYKQRVEAVTAELRRLRPGFTPKVGMVLGSGLGALAEEVEDKLVVPYSELPGFPVSTVPGHAGRLITGKLEGVEVVVMQGRVHLYEGHSAQEVVLPVRALCLWGAKRFVITNAAGSLHREMSPGTLMIIKDHLNMQFVNCLSGPNIDEWGTRFPDMTEPYDKELGKRLRKWADEQKIKLAVGVYGALPGPAYETPSEVQMMANLGADAVGMSTAQEVLALKHMGAKILGISCITNLAAGISPTPLTHEEVGETAKIAAKTFAQVVRASLRLL